MKQTPELPLDKSTAQVRVGPEWEPRTGCCLLHPQRDKSERPFDCKEHKTRLSQPRISPNICSWIFKPQTRPNSTPIKVNKGLPLITVAVGSGPYWCLLEARYKVWLLLYRYTSDLYSLHYLQTCKQARNSDHSPTDLHLHPWLAWWELQRRIWICITQSGSAQKPAGCSKAIRQHKEIEMEFLGEGDH